MRQLPLDIGLRAHASFEEFVPGANLAVVDALAKAAAGTADGGVYLWGGSGVGKTHLLQAACRAAHAAGRRSGYLPLRERAGFAPELLQGLEQLDLVCLDDLDAVAGERAWELALLDLYHRLQEVGGCWAVTAAVPPDGGGWLADLASRLSAAPVFALADLDDADKLRVLQRRAEALGLVLAPEAARYLLTHCRRDLGALCAVLRRLDDAALAAQRRLTVPFIRAVLADPVT